jgi:hypothetical protein
MRRSLVPNDPRPKHPLLLATTGFGIALLLLALLGQQLGSVGHDTSGSPDARSSTR